MPSSALTSRAWALLTCRESRWRWALWREPMTYTVRLRGMTGLPARWPVGVRVGMGPEVAAWGEDDFAVEWSAMDLRSCGNFSSAVDQRPAGNCLVGAFG